MHRGLSATVANHEWNGNIAQNYRVKFMHKKEYLKDPYADFAPKPFTRWDYILCAVAFLLTGIACVSQIAALIVRQ